MSSLVNGVYSSDSGYVTIDSPKNGSTYNWFEKRHMANEKFSFNSLQAAEKEYRKFVKGLSKLGLDNVVRVGQVKDNDRSAIVYFVDNDADYSVNNFLIFHLQKGLVFNMPFNRMRNVTKTQLMRLDINNFNSGLKAKDSVTILKRFLLQVNKHCQAAGVEFSDQIKQLCLLGLNNKFIYDVKIWDTFLKAGLSPLEVAFGLSKDLNPKWQNGTLNITPEVAKGLKDIPKEWIQRMFFDESPRYR